jgi:hypothetical protein
MKKPSMAWEQLSRVGSLLWMKYEPSEIAEEIRCGTDTICKNYIPAGCPHERTATGQIWIIGTDFAAWALRIFGGRSKVVRKTDMGSDQAWCMKCRKPVDIVGLEAAESVHAEMITGKCVGCGSKVYRLRSKVRKPD